MSGFTRDSRFYGDRLVYEPLHSQWDRYHARHCDCGGDWLEDHILPAGFEMLPRGHTGYFGLVGPGLTEGVDESKLTTDVLWEAVTGKPGTAAERGLFYSVPPFDYSEEAQARREAWAAERKTENRKARERRELQREERAAQPATPRQQRYLAALVRQKGLDRFRDEFDQAVTDTEIDPLGADEEPVRAVERLTKAAATNLISALVENP